MLITGANTGIGLVAAKELASKGYDVVLGCRDEGKARAALAAVREAAAPGVTVSLPGVSPTCSSSSSTSFTIPSSSLLDLASLDSVRDFSSAVLDSGRPLHVLLNNAGIMALPQRETTEDGIERQLGVNHVGHFALTSRLLPLLLETAATAATTKEEEGDSSSSAVRVVTVASSAHQFGRIDFTNLNLEKGYSAWGAYGQSKLANVLFAYELARRTTMTASTSNNNDNNGASPLLLLTSNALHPGVVRTELARHLFDSSSAGPLAKLAALATAPFLKTPEQGARTSIFLSSSPDVEGVTGCYFVNSKITSSNAASRDLEVARKLWEVSKEMTGLDPDAAISKAAAAANAAASKKEKAGVVAA